MPVYLIAHVTNLFIEGLSTKSKNLYFALKCTILTQSQNIFTGCLEWAFRHLHVKYLSNWMILKFSHKLA